MFLEYASISDVHFEFAFILWNLILLDAEKNEKYLYSKIITVFVRQYSINLYNPF